MMKLTTSLALTSLLAICTLGCSTHSRSIPVLTVLAVTPSHDVAKAPGAAVRTFQTQWFGGSRTVSAGESLESPSAGFPGPIGLRLPEVQTDPTGAGPTWQSTSDILLRRGRATLDSTGAMTLENGVAFALTKTVQTAGGAQLLLYPIVIRTQQSVEVGTVGTDWLTYAFKRQKSGGGLEDVLLVCLIKSGSPAKGVWVRWSANQTATLTADMTFVQFVDGQRSFWPPQPVNTTCDATDQSPACLIGRVLLDAIQAAKLSGMIPESYSLPSVGS